MNSRRDMSPELTRELRERAQEMVPAVLDAAAAKAREKLIERLSDAIVDEVLAGTGRHGRGSGQPERPAPERPEPERPAKPEQPRPERVTAPAGTAGDSLYAYAITTADAAIPDGLTAVGDSGGSVTTVTHDGLAVIVSGIDARELDGLAEDEVSEESRLATLARRHDAVIRGAGERDAVLPLRFGTVLADSEAAVRLLRDQHEQAKTLLGQVAGHQEWGLRLWPGPEAAPQTPATPNDADRSSGTAFLASRSKQLDAADRHRKQQRDTGAALCERLAEHATSTVERTARGGALREVALLVDSSTESAFLAEADQLAASATAENLRLEVTGPWPPYSFADLEWDTAHA